MKPVLDETHDPNARSWVESANAPGTDFPIQNLPFGVFRRKDDNLEPRIGIAIGDRIVDVSSLRPELASENDDARSAAEACVPKPSERVSLNEFMQLGSLPRHALRKRVHQALRQDAVSSDRHSISRHLISQSDVEMLLPAQVGDYTDFYASIYHATNVGKLFRPDNPLLPNYKYIPIGYHGRASSLIASGTAVRRPQGQTRDANADPSVAPKFGPTRSLDYEMELGFYVCGANSLGEPVLIGQSEERIFGICLVNDWSARDIQSWEYQPLGPFLAKSFATTVSPWVVTIEALAPFRTAAFARAQGDPAPLTYLLDRDDQQFGGLDLWLEVSISSPRMRERGIAPAILGKSNFRDMYWTMAQMLTHHASNGCNLQAGDLLASGTLSGADQSARGCLLELTSRGKDPVTLPSGEKRTFLEDGDEVIVRGYCEREGFRRIGLGGCAGTILPAL
jgi:fumarylacetoacetase